MTTVYTTVHMHAGCTVAALNWRDVRRGLLLRHPETADCRRSDLRPAQRARHKRAAAIFCASCACAVCDASVPRPLTQTLGPALALALALALRLGPPAASDSDY
jgi:hypothetical protein